MTEKHIEPGGVDLHELLTKWPLEAVPHHVLSQEAHHHAIEFKKQSGATPEQIDELMLRLNAGRDLDDYFERKLEKVEPARESNESSTER